MNLSSFYKGKKVLLTGHTGFKGAWLSQMLIGFGAEVSGYALEPNTTENIYDLIQLQQKMKSKIGDIRNLEEMKTFIMSNSPEIVFHLAAQPLVRESYNNPVYTYETNVMGTVNFLEAVRMCPSVKSVVVITTDKVYENHEWCWGYRESDALNGYDPYSNSKSCAELVVSSYVNSFIKDKGIAVSTVRAGNVIGGGDFSKDRIIPDCVRAALNNEPIIVRNPYSTRPYQHVIEPLAAYLYLAMRQFDDKKVAGSYNIGPDDQDCVSTGTLVDVFCKAWGNQKWEHRGDINAPHEANFLKLDCSKIKSSLGWAPMLNIGDAVNLTVEWHKALDSGKNIESVMQSQIESYINKSCLYSGNKE